MNFSVSSSALLGHLQIIGRVLSTKNTMPILDDFLFNIHDNKLTVRSSDLENTMTTSLDLIDSDGDLLIALPAKLLMDTLHEFSEQPLKFEINTDNYAVILKTESGSGVYNFIGQNGEEFPEMPSLQEDENHFTLTIPAKVLNAGVSKTVFATATDDFRPTMTGIYFDIKPDNITFVATDAHKLVRLINDSVKSDITASFILPKKGAGLLRSILASESEDVEVSFDSKNIFFKMPTFELICRQIEGKYPNYNGVIPQNNPFKVIVDRSSLFNSIKRMAIFANQGTNMLKLNISNDGVELSAQDIDFSISAKENISCQYDGDPINIGFKAPLLLEILNNLSSNEITIELADPSRAGIFLPSENEENENMLTLLMPMLIND